MDAYRTATAAGAAITVFLFVAIAIIEIVRVDPVAGIIGVGVGALAAIGAFVAIVLGAGERSDRSRVVIGGLAGFGYAAIALLALRYANVGPAREVLSVTIIAGISLVVAIAAAVRSSTAGRSPR